MTIIFSSSARHSRDPHIVKRFKERSREQERRFSKTLNNARCQTQKNRNPDQIPVFLLLEG